MASLREPHVRKKGLSDRRILVGKGRKVGVGADVALFGSWRQGALETPRDMLLSMYNNTPFSTNLWRGLWRVI